MTLCWLLKKPRAQCAFRPRIHNVASNIWVRERNKPADNTVNTMDAARMATTSMVEKFREIQLLPEISVGWSIL